MLRLAGWLSLAGFGWLCLAGWLAGGRCSGTWACQAFVDDFVVCEGDWEGQNEANCLNHIGLVEISDILISEHSRLIFDNRNRSNHGLFAEFNFV